MAIELDHPAYDCVYLTLALDNGWRLATADDRLLGKLGRSDARERFENVALSMSEAAESVSRKPPKR